MASGERKETTMNQSKIYPYWHDARTQAVQASWMHGHAWIVSTYGDSHDVAKFHVIASDSLDDAPGNFIAEYMDGEEQ